MMTDARLLELIAAYGADPAAYPDAEQDAARALLDAAPERFEAALQGEQSLDVLFAGLDDIVPSAAFEAKLIASGPLPAPAPRNVFGWRPKWPALGGAMASLAVGVIAGLSVATPVAATETTAEEVETLVMAALGASDYDLIQESDYE